MEVLKDVLPMVFVVLVMLIAIYGIGEGLSMPSWVGEKVKPLVYAYRKELIFCSVAGLVLLLLWLVQYVP